MLHPLEANTLFFGLKAMIIKPIYPIVTNALEHALESKGYN